MNTRTSLSIGLAALALAGALAGQGIASADNTSAKAAAKVAGADAKRAAKAMDRGRAEDAVGFAEHAVALAPRSAEYRMLLGQSYLQAGRFRSAAQAFADVLALDAGHARAALNLSLMQVATGDWQSARATLDAHADRLAPADRGLALALAGDPAGGVQLLMATARAPGATATVRQNLALALALSGQWQAARVVAATDMSPADVDARMTQWAAFAQPRAASDQVSALLAVIPVADPGQPTALALNAPLAPVVRTVQAAAAEPALPALPGAEVVAQAPGPIASPVPTPIVAGTPVAAIAWGPRREVVQPLPAPFIKADAAPMRLALAQARITPRIQPLRATRPMRAGVSAALPAVTGSWHVQLGAYRNTAVARDAWQRFARRTGFAGRLPNGSTLRTADAALFRLSVGGLSRADADALCRRHRAGGNACFVRAGAGDQVVRWDARPGTRGVQLASRS